MGRFQAAAGTATMNPDGAVHIMTIDPRSEARAALSGLLDRLTAVALTVGLVSTIAGLVRVSSQGWHVNVVTDLVFFGSIIGVLLLRKRLPFVLVVWALVVLAAASAVASFLTLGLGTMSFVILTACCVVVGVAFGNRLAFAVLAVCVVVVGLIGVAVTRGVITGQQVTDPFLLDPKTWITQIAGFAAYTAAILAVGGALQSRLSRTVDEISEQAERLRESEQRYRLLADNMEDVLYLQDVDLNFRYVSPSAERLFGYTSDEFTGLDVGDLMAPDSLERAGSSYRHHMARAADEDVEIPAMEYEYVRRDGSTFWGEVKPTLIRDHEGRVIGSQGLIRDVTRRKLIERERQELERELHQADTLKSIGQLAGGIAHDFNNQLAPIMAHADILARGLASADTVPEHARKILGPARNAAELTGKLLAFARKGAYELRPVDLHEVIDDVVEILVHGIDRRIRVTRHYEAETAVVEGDLTQLQNVILNLALNARDALPQGGAIVFTTRIVDGTTGEPGDRDRWIEVMVRDSGHGMEAAVLERAFEPFFTTKAPGKGTGMGLAAAYGTVRTHGGEIAIDSTPGQGTEVTIRLPLSERAAPGRDDTASDVHLPVAGRALVVDDEEGVRTALCDLLDALGFTVEPFESAAAAVARYEACWREIDLVVLDLVLPDMTGDRALTAIRDINPEARVLLVSGYAADDAIRELQRDGATEFLEKPFLLADMAERLARLLNLP